MNDAPDLCMVINLPDRTCICRAPTRRVANALQRALLDTAVIQVSREAMRKDLNDMVAKGHWIEATANPVGVSRLENRPEQYIMDKAKRAVILRGAFVTLQWYENHIVNVYDGVASLSVTDVPVYAKDPDLYAEAYAASTGLSKEQAAKQLEFDYETIRTVILRSRSIWWKFQELAETIQTPADCIVWNKQLHDEVFGVGMV